MKNLAFAIVAALACGALATFPTIFVARSLETNYAPVTVRTVITKQERTDSTELQIWGRSTKVRACDFRGIEWNRGLRGLPNVTVFSHFGESDKIRPKGTFEWGPWVLNLSDKSDITETHATVYHQCYLLDLRWLPFWWHTVTHFYH